MIPYLNGIENCWAWLLITWLTHHFHLYSKLIQKFDHAIASISLLALRCQDLTNILIPFMSMELWTHDSLQDGIWQVLLDFIDLIYQELNFNHQNYLRYLSDKYASAVLLMQLNQLGKIKI